MNPGLAISRATKRQRYLLLTIIVGAVVLLGIFIAVRIDRSRAINIAAPAGRELIISAITLGTPLDAAEAARPEPRLRQRASYTTTTPIALRITADPAVTYDFTVSTRLVTTTGTIIELDPSQATFRPGTSTFCCWHIDEPGKYTLQIFRPEKVITSLPLLIEAGIEQRPLL